jgi:putative aminopeptidase FrvX
MKPISSILSTTSVLAGLFVATGAAAPLRAQQDLAAIASWVALDAATGYETRTAPALAAALPGWQADPWGNVVLEVGSGTPERIVACQLDRPGYAVSRITEDGYLRVHRIGRGSDHPLWDQAWEAQQVRVLTEAGPVAGVVARSNGHFAQQHRNETDIVTADDLWVDVGAESAADVESLGIHLLDPVSRHVPPWTMEAAVAGPDAGRRAGCAALVSVAEAARRAATTRGRTRWVLSAQSELGWVGLSSLVARGGAVDEVVMVGSGMAASADGPAPRESLDRLVEILDDAGVASLRRVAPAVRDPGAMIEVLTRGEAERLRAAVASAAAVTLPPDAPWTPAPGRRALLSRAHRPGPAAIAGTLTDLVELHAVSGHEWTVRRYILEHLPRWARDVAVVDDIGDIMVAVGPDRDTTVFMAHMDEVGYEVASIAGDGTVTLTARGGAVSSAWEGQTALLRFDPADAPSTARADGTEVTSRWKQVSLAAEAPPPIRGVFLTREHPESKHPREMRAWFGLDSAALVSRGVSVGAGVTSHKEGLRIGENRFTARALDDRAGSTALLEAVKAVDPGRVPSKVLFTWSVHEEGGLRGAAAMARRFGRSARRVYSVDTFVSSDTPLESDHFAYAPLGDGPVLRAIESSSVSPPSERARVLRIAREAGIDLQIGLTQGGTDGTRFTFFGAPNQGLSWPGRYSHSPGEVLDLRDLERLRDLIVAIALEDGGR